jgi:simple sugar transport system substrate-binding protein
MGYKIATIVKVKKDQSWAYRMEEGVNRFKKETGHECWLIGPDSADNNLQKKMVEDVIAEGIDALCLVPLFPQALELTLTMARRKSGLIVITNEASNQRNMDYDIEAIDNKKFGTHLMEDLAKHMNGTGQYAIFLETLTSRSQSEWAKAAIDHQKQNYPNMILSASKIEHRNDRVLAKKEIEKLHESHDKVQGILCIGETATEVVGEFVHSNNLSDEVAVVGSGLVAKDKRYLFESAVKSVGLWDPGETAYVMNKLAVMLLDKKEVKDGLDMGVPGYDSMKLDGKIFYASDMISITKENLSKYNF